jgi:carbon storage regulator
MFVLNKRLGEKIHIGNDITVTVVETNGNRVRLSIEAPDQLRIQRARLPGQSIPNFAPGGGPPPVQF